MKQKWLFLLFVIFALLLASCAKSDAPETPKAQSDAPAVQADPVAVVQTEPVTEAFRSTFTNRATGYISYQVFPKINVDGAYAEEVNREIAAFIEERVDDDGKISYTGDYSYVYYVYEDILSVIICEVYPEQIDTNDFAMASMHKVYTLHLSDGSEATTEELLSAAGVSADAFYPRATELMGNAFCQKLPEEMVESYLAMEEITVENNGLFRPLMQTVREENAKAVQAYLNAEGELCFAGTIYQIAGATGYSRIFSMSQTVMSPYYEALMAKLAQID